MKYLNYFSLQLLLLGFIACGSNGDNNDPLVEANLECSPTSVSIGYEGDAIPLSVKCEREWMVYSDDAWITPERNPSAPAANANALITVVANNSTAGRTGTVVVKSGATRVSITVKQAGKPEAPVDPNIKVPEGYQLVWQDEFNDASLSMPNEQLWSYETGAGGWGNNEIQTYIPGKKDGVICAPVGDGILKIIAKKVGNEVYSIRVNSKESWKYGYFEARLKLPTGKGTWPAFWMMPKNFTSWPADGEIDIMEEVGYDPNVILSTIHCNAYNHSKNTQKSGTKRVPTAQTEFHVYALEWTENVIKGYVDGECYFVFNNDKKGNKDTWPFDAPFYLKLNLAWGGNWGGAMGIDESALPATYEIDYVRVFQKK